MEANPVLLAILAIQIGITLYNSVIRYPFKYNRGWVAVCVVVAALTGVMLLINPDYAGLFGFAAWVILVIIPSLGTRYAMNMAAQGRYTRAIWISRMMRWLHPADNLLSMPDIIQAQAYEYAGDSVSAVKLLEQYRKHPQRWIYANTQIFRIKGQYQELITWLDRNITAERYRRDPSLLQFYFYGLGSLGKLNEMVARFMEYRSVLERVPAELTYNYLLIFTNCGLPERVRQIFDSQYRNQAEPLKAVWIAVAEIAAGNIEQGTLTLQQLATSNNRIASGSAKRKLNDPVQ
ncbi:MAG TPA: hypothetical protein VHL11_01915, partial [Phototrophicaceae bacterium]|nr:hypothetical protein [Phototrophicaceae bacterium]